MFKPFLISLFLLVTFNINSSFANTSYPITLTEQQTEQLANFIWQNEGAGKVEYLTTWNKGEDFPSLGIAHFIWYPTAVKGPYIEQFPQLLTYFQSNNISLPKWLTETDVAPWTSREQFYRAYHQPKLTELRQLLTQTKSLQAKFVILRLQQALPNILAHSSPQQQQILTSRIEQLTATPAGVFVLLDYVNFKGEGTSINEQYQGQGWGLKQVLLAMPEENDNLLRAFAYAADEILTRRVKNAPRDESQWLPGWRKRVHQYPDLINSQAN